jgi:hypothetical protein
VDSSVEQVFSTQASVLPDNAEWRTRVRLFDPGMVVGNQHESLETHVDAVKGNVANLPTITAQIPELHLASGVQLGEEHLLDLSFLLHLCYSGLRGLMMCDEIEK